MFLVQGREEMAVMTEVAAVLLHHFAMYKGTDGNVVSTG